LRLRVGILYKNLGKIKVTIKGQIKGKFGSGFRGGIMGKMIKISVQDTEQGFRVKIQGKDSG
jgi:hypothetical protein